jgi:enoyl-CoA hydratase
MQQAQLIIHEKQGPHGSLGCITLNCPHRYNALDVAMCTSIARKLDHWSKQLHIKLIVIDGAGDKAFCAGGDLKQMAHSIEQKREHPIFRIEYLLYQQILNYPKPIVVLMHGFTMGGGAGLAMYASHRIALPNILWAMPEVHIGFFPDVGASHFLTRLPKGLDLLLGLTGTQCQAPDILALGFAEAVIEDKDKFVTDLLQQPFGQKTTTKLIDQLIHHYKKPQQESPLLNLFQQYGAAFQEKTIKQILTKLQQQQATHPWFASMMAASPLSLVLSQKLLQWGRTQNTVASCLNKEYQLAKVMLKQPDLAEGIRAAVIDKDRKPKWQHQTRNWNQINKQATTLWQAANLESGLLDEN